MIYHTTFMCKKSLKLFIFWDSDGFESTALYIVDLLAHYYIIQGPVSLR